MVKKLIKTSNYIFGNTVEKSIELLKLIQIKISIKFWQKFKTFFSQMIPKITSYRALV